MRRAEAIVFAFRALGETGKASALPQCFDPVPPSGQDFVRVGLVSDVPNPLVVGRVEYIVQCNCELDDTQARAKMPTGHRDGADGLRAQFVCNLLEVTR